MPHFLSYQIFPVLLLREFFLLLTAIGRTLIPRYFRSIFEGGVTELYYSLKHPKESFHNTSITLDCDQCTMVTHHGKPMYTKVSTYPFLFKCVGSLYFYCTCLIKECQPSTLALSSPYFPCFITSEIFCLPLDGISRKWWYWVNSDKPCLNFF